MPQRSGSALGRPAPPLAERAPDPDTDLPAPVCEASSLLMLSDHTWVVADNEIHERLFGFTRTFDVATRFGMPGGHRPRDIEAMARVGDAEFLVVGSHSDRRDGSFSEKRHRLRWVAFDHQARTRETHFSDASSREWRSSITDCVRVLFVDDGDQERRFCTALVEGGEMDIEGAATIDGQIWLGFRRPLVDEHAIMARLSGRSLHFDAIRRIDLGGRGIRAMDDFEDELFVVGGPSEDAEDPHMLFRVLADGAVPLMPLPRYAEGLAIHSPGHALIVTDGRQGEHGECAEASSVQAITWTAVETAGSSE